MKKLILVIAITASTLAFLSCSQQNTELETNGKTALLNDSGRANFNAGLELTNRNAIDRTNLAQADYSAN